MIKLIYDKRNCVGCPPEWGCMGKDCPQCWETKMICDACGDEDAEELWRVEGDDLCEYCFNQYVLNHFLHITADNAGDFADENTD